MVNIKITDAVKVVMSRFPALNAVIWDVQYRLGMWDSLDKATGAQVIALLDKYTATPDILDLGCGKGINLNFPENGYRRYHGVDISAHSIALARKHARPGASFEVADILSYETAERYDAVLVREVLYYIPNRQIAGFLHRAAGFLKPDGKIFIQLWDKASCAEYLEIITDAGFLVREEHVVPADAGPESTVVVLDVQPLRAP